MKIPLIEVKLSRSYCLYDFLSRLSYYGPYEKERILYSKRLRKIRNVFFEFVAKNRGKNYEFFIKNISKFSNKYFRSLWREFSPILSKQHSRIKTIIKKDGESYLKKILSITKIKKYPYKKIIVFLSFPKIVQIKPRKYGSTGSPNVYGDICKIYIGLSPNGEYKDANDLYVLWHEIIHSIEIPRWVREDIREAIAELYEDIIRETPKRMLGGRLFRVFKRYPEKLRGDFIKTCVNWDWKKKDIFELEAILARKLRS